MKVSFAALGLLLISAAQALPLPETNKCHVAKVQNSTAPVTKSLHKRSKVFDIFPVLGKFDDLLLQLFFDMGRRVAAMKEQPISNWDDKENNRFESNAWALSPHELNVIEAIVEQSGRPA